MVRLCKTIISPGFFSFFKILIFHVVRGSKKAKNGPKMRKNSFCCPPYLRNHTSWFSFLVNVCKMMTSPDAFFIFSKFWTSQVVREVEGQKNCPKWQNILSVVFQISGNDGSFVIFLLTCLLQNATKDWIIIIFSINFY